MPIDILMPALSPTMTEGTLAKWLVAEGDDVASGDVIAEIETDKATMEVEAVEEGKIAKILIADGTEGVAVNAVIAVLVEDGEAYDPSAAPAPQATSVTSGDLPEGQIVSSGTEDASKSKAVPSAQSLDTISAAQKSLGMTGAGGGKRVKASPLARRIAKQRGIDIAALKGTGPGERIIKRDVENANPVTASSGQGARVDGATAPATPQGPTPFTAQKPSSIRKIIAQRLSESKFTSPHFYVTMDIELDALLALRKQINADPDVLKVSVNDLLIMASGRALKAVPEANCAWVGDEVHQYERADVSVAVALNGGLVTPVVRGADSLTLSQISDAAEDLIGRARDGKLLPEEMQGGSFSISNMGMMGVKHFTAIINPPQGAILAVGAGEKRPVVRGDALEIATVMTCTLSSDHRVIDGAVAAEFLGTFKDLIENPVRLLV